MTLFIPYIGWQSTKYFKVLIIYLGCISVLYSLICIIDLEFYKELGTHLNILAIQPNTRSKELWTFMWDEYPIIYYLIFIFIIMLIWIKILLKFISYKFDQATSSAKQIIFFVISFLLTGIFARGGLQERPIDWGHAMFSNNQFANQLALNPLFNFGRSVVQLNSEKNISKIIHFMDDKTALDISKKMILAPNEKFIDSLSFKRKIISPKSIEPNIVFIILESFLGNYCGFINNNNYDITPNLNKIAKEGINFSKTIASGKRSAFGLGSILCSWPVLPGLPLISSLESQKNIDTIGSLLKKINYSTYFLFGGDADFDNMKGFVKSNGFDKVIERDDFPSNTPGTMWGVFDEYLFSYAQNILDTTSNPTLITLFTITNHQPWIIPADKEKIIPQYKNQKTNSDILRTVTYTDYVIGQFIDQNKNKEWFNNTIFVFVADHGVNEFSAMYEDPRNAHIPFLIYSPDLISEPFISNQITSQVDIVPTLLHIIGYPKEFNLMGSNILREGYNGFACRIINDYGMWLDSEFLFTEVFNQYSKVFKYTDFYQIPYLELANNGEIFNQIQTNFHAYIQSAYIINKKR